MTRITEALLTAIIALLVILIAAEAYSDRATPSPSPVVSSSVQDVASHPAVRSEPVSPERAEPAPLTDVAGRVVGRAPSGRIAQPLIGGRATWYPASGMIAAAGPALRHYLGRHWRGTLVDVCSGGRCVVVRVSDWCACRGSGGRLIDLSADAFAQLAPLSRGVIPVEILRAVRLPEPPATDVGP